MGTPVGIGIFIRPVPGKGHPLAPQAVPAKLKNNRKQ
jgi:hypothetical protein